jgi:hypothetical protein
MRGKALSSRLDTYLVMLHGQIRHWAAPLAAAALVCSGLTACSDPAPPAASPKWQAVADQLPGALLSVHGVHAKDVWVVGADGGKTGLALHWDGTSWTKVETGQLHDIWWVHAFASNDVFVSGAGGTILRWDGSKFSRMPTPGFGAHTVYGLWGSSSSDVWAAGGVSGRYGFLWHFDGTAWANVPLPDEVPLTDNGELPALFKVWGRNAKDVYAVGGHGLMLHYDGAVWKRVPTQTDELIFTVAGDSDEVVAVGGSAMGVVLDADGKPQAGTDFPLLQGVDVGPDGTAWACGSGGAIYSRNGTSWRQVDLGTDDPPQSLHAIWVDPDGGVWTVGGNVLTAALDDGTLFYRGKQKVAAPPAIAGPDPAATTCPEALVDAFPDQSMARRWNEQLIASIRRDIPRPGVHARNLYHSSLAMYDAWAAFTPQAKGVLTTDKVTGTAADVDKAVAVAALRILTHRYQKAIGGAVSTDCYNKFATKLGIDPTDGHTDGSDPVAVGNRVGQLVIDTFANDGANEANDYADVTGYNPANPALIVDQSGVPFGTNPDIWQEINLAVAETQNGLIVDAGKQTYIGTNWGFVTGFATPKADTKGIVHDWPSHPTVADVQMKAWTADMIRKSADLDHLDGRTIDLSPGAYGNNPLGTNDGKGHPLNPITNQPYTANVVPMGDFARVLAEFWADGPKSETPPGHWFVLANSASDELARNNLPLRLFGQGDAVPRLQWDVSLYLALGGAVHDAAIAAWGLKRGYLGPRPITLVRWMAQNGQSSDPTLPGYHKDGLPLQAGLIELITAETTAPGQRHHHLRWWQGQVAVRSWLGEPGDRAHEVGVVGWMRGVDWTPYQRRTFVTPGFPGYVSGHSTFSRAAAEVLSGLTGSPYFPGGFAEYVAKKNAYLVFEEGPSTDVRLQWATYSDAADQAGQSRIWGGIHIWPDDADGRLTGDKVGKAALAKAKGILLP